MLKGGCHEENSTFADRFLVYNREAKMPVAIAMKNNVYYLGHVKYNKKWLLDQVISNEDEKKQVLLSIVKQVFDSKVYKGPRCGETGCVTKGKCPLNRKFRITMVRRTAMETEEKGWRSVMIHAYKTGEVEETVFESYIAASGNPLKMEFSAVGVLKPEENQSVPNMEKMVEGEIAEIEENDDISQMRAIMEKAVRPDCTADVITMHSEGYEQ